MYGRASMRTSAFLIISSIFLRPIGRVNSDVIRRKITGIGRGRVVTEAKVDLDFNVFLRKDAVQYGRLLVHAAAVFQDQLPAQVKLKLPRIHMRAGISHGPA